jgi:hypothetical protein
MKEQDILAKDEREYKRRIRGKGGKRNVTRIIP